MSLFGHGLEALTAFNEVGCPLVWTKAFGIFLSVATCIFISSPFVVNFAEFIEHWLPPVLFSDRHCPPLVLSNLETPTCHSVKLTSIYNPCRCYFNFFIVLYNLQSFKHEFKYHNQSCPLYCTFKATNEKTYLKSLSALKCFSRK